MRVRASGKAGADEDRNLREAFLVRKSNDGAVVPTSRKASTVGGSGRWLMRDVSGSSASSTVGGGSTPGSVTEGVGVDTRRYVEGLLSLNR